CGTTGHVVNPLVSKRPSGARGVARSGSPQFSFVECPDEPMVLARTVPERARSGRAADHVSDPLEEERDLEMSPSQITLRERIGRICHPLDAPRFECHCRVRPWRRPAALAIIAVSALFLFPAQSAR